MNDENRMNNIFSFLDSVKDRTDFQAAWNEFKPLLDILDVNLDTMRNIATYFWGMGFLTAIRTQENKHDRRN